MERGHKTVRFEIFTAEGGAKSVISFLAVLGIKSNYGEDNGTF